MRGQECKYKIFKKLFFNFFLIDSTVLNHRRGQYNLLFKSKGKDGHVILTTNKKKIVFINFYFQGVYVVIETYNGLFVLMY